MSDKKEKIAKYIGENYGGPILVSYVKWILDKALENDIFRLYFIARDGYILKEIADIYIAHFMYPIQTHYIYGSRRTWRTGIYIQKEIDIIELLDESYRERINSIKKLAKIFQIEESELNRFLPKCYQAYKKKLILDDIYVIQNYLEKSPAFKRFLRIKHKDSAKRVIEYLKQEIDVRDEKFAFIEVFGSGYSQNGMSLLINTFYDKPIKNFFYYQHRKQSGNNIFYSFARDEMNIKILIEVLCRSLEGQTIDYCFSGKSWEPVQEQGEKELLNSYRYGRYIEGVINYTKKHIEDKLSVNYEKKWQKFCDLTFKPIVDYIGDMPYGVIGTEKEITRFAPRLNVWDYIYIFVNGLEYEEQNRYTGAMISYSMKRVSTAKRILVNNLLENKHLKFLQERNKEKQINNRLKDMDYFMSFPYIRGKRIVVYGAGRIGRQMVKKILLDKTEKLVLWIDQTENLENAVFPVSKPEAISSVEYDYVILASVCKKHLDSMLTRLRKLNVLEKTVVY